MAEKLALGWGVNLASADDGSPEASPGAGEDYTYTMNNSVKMAVVTPLRPARLIVVGANYWMSDGRAGYAGFNGQGTPANTLFMEDSRRTLNAMVQWLAHAGSSVLIVGVKSTPAAPAGLVSFGYQFSDGLEAYGHTATWTGDYSGWGPYDPVDFDVLACGFFPTYGGLTGQQDVADYLLQNGVSILCNGVTTFDIWRKYGIRASAGSHGADNPPGEGSDIHISGYGPTQWTYQRPFEYHDEETQFGDPGTGGSWSTNYYALSMYTTGGVMPDDESWTMGGTREFVQCALPQQGGHSDVDNDGLNVIATWRPS